MCELYKVVKIMVRNVLREMYFIPILIDDTWHVVAQNSIRAGSLNKVNK
jgi:hypothetical protein